MDNAKKQKLILFSIFLIFVVYVFIYKPFFTLGGRIERETDTEKKIIFHACTLPEDHKYYKMFKKECDKMIYRAEYEDIQQD